MAEEIQISDTNPLLIKFDELGASIRKRKKSYKTQKLKKTSRNMSKLAIRTSTRGL